MKKSKNIRVAILFLLPATVLYSVFMVYPIIQSINLSFYSWNGIASVEPVFIGLKNYISMFQDQLFLKAFKNTSIYMIINLLIKIPIGLLLAIFIANAKRGARYFKAAFFMPVILSSTAIALMWKFILTPNSGLLTTIMNNIGLEDYVHVWLADLATVMPAISLVGAWQGIGYVMILLLAAVVNVPGAIIESAIIDGASSWQQTMYIIIPLIWGAIKTNIVLLIVGAIKVCELIFVMTGGGPFYASEVLTTYMYTMSFSNGNFGYGSSIATFIFLLGVTLTLITNKLMKKDSIEY